MRRILFRFWSGCSALAVVASLILLTMRAAAQDPDADEPAAERASFQVADGFEVNLFASEKDGVVKPIQIRFDARGRLWVIGSTVYPQLQPGQTPNDKVRILEDTNGDGICDKTTVFADGLMIPTGIELGGGGAYVAQGSELLFLRDNNGDDRADERHIFMRGFGTGDNHQNINSFAWGPGGELWMSQGLHIHSSVETPWGVVRMDQAGLWRLRPRRQRLDAFYGSQYEPQNPWGFVFTDWGEPIVISGNNSSAIYSAPGLVVNHRDAPPPLIWRSGNMRKSSGGDIVGTAHFPDAWQGALIQGGYINNAIWALKVLDDGAGFSLEDMPPLIKSSSRSFRPVDVKFGPDGALYLCDWYNPIIGHYQASFRHPDRDKVHGRIWRVTAKGRALTRPPKLADASVADLLEHLKSPDRWTRHYAKRVLADRPTGEVTTALRAFVGQTAVPELALVEALGVYQSHEIIASELISRLCHAKEPGARAYAASAVGGWADRLNDPLNLLRPLVADENPRVRLQAVVACTYVPTAEAMEVAAIAADFATDRFLDYALNQAVFALKPYWLPSFRTGKLNLQNKSTRLGLLIRADGTADTISALRHFIQSPALSMESREYLLHLLAEVGDANDLANLLRKETFSTGADYDAGQQARVLETVVGNHRRDLPPAGDCSKALGDLSRGGTNRALEIAVLHLAAQWKLPRFEGAARQAAFHAAKDIELGIAGTTALAAQAGNGGRNSLNELARPSRALGERVAAAVGFTGFDLPRAAEIAAGVLAADGRGEFVAHLLPPFLQRREGSAVLASALAEKSPSREAARAALSLLNAAGRQNQQLVRAFESASGFTITPLKFSPDQTQELARQAGQSGDARHGAAVFRRPELGCIACHTVNGQGGTIGPDLSAVGTAHPMDFIIGAILEPQKEIKEGFMSVSLTTKDGEEYQGYQVRETADELVLRDVLQKREVRLRRDTIAQNKQNGSLMPSGLADSLSPAEFRDLVRFLSELGTTSR